MTVEHFFKRRAQQANFLVLSRRECVVSDGVRIKIPLEDIQF